MTLFVLWNNERFFLNPEPPEWAHFNPIRWHLVPYGLGGTIALVLGAMQFSTRLRERYPQIHRLIPRAEIERAAREWQDEPQRSDEQSK
jgi:hypothetical protein